jgi:TonB family protein
MKEYRSWSFTDRWFWYAMAVSVLWHAFWFFSITIVVNAPARRPMVQPRIVSLGPVLDDAIFRTLVETRPEVSKAFYRQPADFSTATDVPTETLERFSPGDVVSVPKGFQSRLREVVGGEKASPVFTDGPSDYFTLSGIGASQVISHPQPPAASSEVRLEFSLDERGRPEDIQVLSSSGDRGTDTAWQDHLSRWVFASEGLAPGERFSVTFHAGAGEAA